MSRSRLANLVGIAIGVAGLAFVTSRVLRDRAAIGDALAAADLTWLAAALAAGTVAMALIGLNWVSILHHAGAAAPWRRAMAWFFVGQLGKYVPGGIWPIVGQAELAHRAATPRGAAYSSTAWSMVATFLGASIVAAVSGLFGPSDHVVLAAALAALVLLTFTVIAVPAVRRPIDRLVERFTSRRLRLPDPRWFALVVARHLPVWLAFAGMHVFVVGALGIELDAGLAVELVFVSCVSWMAGFVIVGVPGGIGVRETVFISMTTASLGASVAVSAAVLARVVSIAADLLGAAGAVAVAGTAPAAVEPSDGRADPVAIDRYASP